MISQNFENSTSSREELSIFETERSLASYPYGRSYHYVQDALPPRFLWLRVAVKEEIPDEVFFSWVDSTFLELILKSRNPSGK
jgi:hypothetical protein